MKKWKLRNGMTLIYEPKKGGSVAVQVLVNVGSDWEEKRVRGISHYVEHMVFEGTTKRANAKIIANDIEKVGGISNAYTTNSRTCYHAKVPKNHADIALDVTADILQNPLFREEDTKRQKNILFKEIDLVTDEPRYHQWIIFQKVMFKEHPSRNPTYGTRKTVQNTTAKDLKDFFEKYYVPSNMIMSVVGEVPNIKQKVEKLFEKKKGKRVKWKKVFEKYPTKIRSKKEKRKGVASTYFVLGHRTPERLHKDSYVVDVINGILGRGQSGWMFDEIRNKHGLAYEVGTEHVSEIDYGFFVTYLSVNKKSCQKAKDMVLAQLKKLESVTENDVKEAKTYIEGGFMLDWEDTQKRADDLVFWEHIGDARLVDDYIKKIKKVTVKDVRRVAKKYFNKPYCTATIEGVR